MCVPCLLLRARMLVGRWADMKMLCMDSIFAGCVLHSERFCIGQMGVC